MDDYKLTFEDIPTKPERVGRAKMPKSTSTNEPSKAVRKYSKTRGEHIKDILIAVLVTAVIAFIGGMHFSNQHNAEMQSAVKAAQVSAQTEAKK